MSGTLGTAPSSNLTVKHRHIHAYSQPIKTYVIEGFAAVISRSGLCFVSVGFVYGCFGVGVTSFIGSLLGLYL